MAAPQKFSREKVIEAGLNVWRKQGFDSINARNIASEAGFSTRPIYEYFSDMVELKNELIHEAEELYYKNVREYTESGKYFPYLAWGMAFIKMAAEEKEFFRYFYFDSSDLKRSEDEFDRRILEVIKERFGWSEATSLRFQEEMFTHVFGYATLVNTGRIDFNEELASKCLLTQFIGLKYALIDAKEDSI